MVTYDKKIMDQLLNEPGIKEQVAIMKPETLEFYKELLVTQGIYAQYVREHTPAESDEDES